MVLEPDVVAQAVRRAEAGAGSVVVPETSFGTGFWARVKALERSCYLGDETIEAARAFTRGAFDAVGGYDEGIVAGPEDWDLHQRVRAARFRTARTEAFIHHDEGRLTLRETMATKYYYGKSTRAYLLKHGDDARRQLTVARPAFLRQWRRLAARPVLAIAVIVMKSAELAAGAAGLLVSEVRTRRTR
jgi:arabinofuranan 3-O-arabinosyltransferase